MRFQLTYKKLNELLTNLGFEPRDVTKTSSRRWRHPESGCTLLLPANKMHDPPRPADLVGIKAQLGLQCHLDEHAFELFVTEGRLPVAATERQ